MYNKIVKIIVKGKIKLKKKHMIMIIILIIFIIWGIPTIILFNIGKKNIRTNNFNTMKKNGIYNVSDLYKTVKKELIYQINIESNIIYSNILPVSITIENFDLSNTYEIKAYIDDKENIIEQINDKNKEISIGLEEGKHNIKFEIYQNNEKVAENTMDIFCVIPYKKQFLDEYSNVGISTHYIKNYDDIGESLELLKSLGVKSIRNSIKWSQINKNNQYNFENIDYWMDKLKKEDIKVLAILLDDTVDKIGNDYQISNENEFEGFSEYINQVIEKYNNNIVGVEVWNEPNIKWTSDDAKMWYTRIVEATRKNTSKKVIAGSTATPYQTSKSEEYIKSISKLGSYSNSNAFSYHIYSHSNDMKWLKEKNASHKETANSLGGFQYLYITEYGVNDTNITSDKEKSQKIVKQTINNISQGVHTEYLYNFIDDSENVRYGLLTKENTPKDSYFAMKNYLQNTNGAEYIGKLNLLEGLETHIYDKDGTPLLITWSNDTNKNIEINYNGFVAKDLYGKEIEPNENGKIVITNSPVYIYNLDSKYYYETISNLIETKYSEFKQKYKEYIKEIPELTTQIERMEEYIENIGKSQNTISETSSIEAMKKHYELGNIILKAYEEEKIDIEKEKLSSILDELNDIGNSYEDLVTVTAQTRNIKLDETKDSIEKIEQLINNNIDLNIIYPNKILEFSKDCYEKAEYINKLEEENDIKTGLIVSNNLHSQLLANWSNKFAQIYINQYVKEYIKNNPVTIEYSETGLTNKDVKATLKTNANIEITNNDGKNEYTFITNGIFEFEYKVRGKEFSIIAKVDNIDKEAPTITGVQDGKIYTDSVTPKITDKNLDIIELKLNGEKIEKYTTNTILTEEGFYEIIAKDKAENISNIKFQIIVNYDNRYRIEKDIIKNISGNTTKSEFDEKINLNIKYKILRNEKEMGTDDKIATGDILETQVGDRYTLIVTGDINKDGQVNIKDFIKMKIYLLDSNNLDETEEIAADCDLDEKKIGVKDYIRLRLIILMNM